jgi:hypothetical protein
MLLYRHSPSLTRRWRRLDRRAGFAVKKRMGKTIVSEDGCFEWDELLFTRSVGRGLGLFPYGKQINRRRRSIMAMSKVLTVEELERIRDLPVVYTQDAPKLTKEQLARMKLKRRAQNEEITERWLAEPAVVD